MPKHVLLIEDEPNIIEAISFILSRDGWTVNTHSNGTTAVDTVHARRPDILRELREHPETEGLPVLMLTARGQTKDREMAERAGVNAFMAKPFSNSEMLEMVRSLSTP